MVVLLVIVVAAGANSGGNKKGKTATTSAAKVAATSSATTTTTATTTTSTGDTDAQRLAAYQEGVPSVGASVPLVAKINTQLNRLAPDCRESRDRVAGEAWASWKDLRKNGVNESIPSVLKHIRKSIPHSLAPTNCAQIMAAYLVLRER